MDRRIRHHLGRARAAAQERPVRVRTPLAARVADLLAIVPKIHPSKRIEMTSRVAPDIAVACEAQDLDEMLGNLIDNAAKWAAKRMRVSASTAGGEVTVVIEDDGPGLVDDKAPEAMQPDRKLDESTPGYGFGLRSHANSPNSTAAALSFRGPILVGSRRGSGFPPRVELASGLERRVRRRITRQTERSPESNKSPISKSVARALPNVDLTAIATASRSRA